MLSDLTLAVVLLADHNGDHMSGWGWGMMALFTTLFAGLLITAIWALVTYSNRSRPGPEGGSAEELLAERYARGELTTEEYQERLESLGLPFGVDRAAGRLRLLSDPNLAETVQRLQKEAKPERITQAALETLAIVAYRQPVTKAEIEAIRGVQAGPVLRALVDRGLIKVTGRADVPGHPLQYGTTPEFLDRFGLMNLEELPRDAELARG